MLQAKGVARKRRRPRKTANLELRKVLRRAVREQNPDVFYDWSRRRLYGEE
jgi:hypothetical protein